MSRKLAAEYTFFLAIPVMFGASFLKLVKFGLHFTGTEVVYLLLGMVVAFGVSIAAIQVPDGLYQETRFQGIWMVPDRSWCCGTCLFPACIK